MLRNRFGGSLAAMRGVYANPNLRRVQLAAAGASIGQFAYGVAIAVYAYSGFDQPNYVSASMAPFPGSLC